MIAAESKNVPELRFPEFEGEWEHEPLGDNTFWSSGGTPSKENSDYWAGNIPWISAVSMHLDSISDSNLKISIDGLKNGSKLAQPGSVLMLVRGSMLFKRVPIGIVKTDVAFNQDVKSLVPKNNISTAYLFYWLKAKEHKLLSMVVGTGIGAGKLETSDLKILPLPILEEAEQQKIATFLGTVDDKLTALRRKRELLQDYKRGMMQKIFSRELRFKREDGSDFPDWVEKRLGEIFDFVRTNSLSRNQLTYEPQRIQNIHYGDIHTKFKAQFHQDKEAVPYVKNDNLSWNVSDDEFCREGDLVMADASEDYADIGKTIEIIGVKKRSLVAGLHTYIARQKNNDFVLGFAGYVMQSEPIRKQIMRIAQGISVLGISKPNLLKLAFWKPHRDEQQKIADFFSAIDSKIEAVGKQVEQVEIFKKGLLQKMFV